MTLPFEEKRSLKYAREFLFDLLDPQKTPKTPKKIRQRASLVVHHFPYDHRIDELFNLAEQKERKLCGKKYVDIRHNLKEEIL